MSCAVSASTSFIHLTRVPISSLPSPRLSPKAQAFLSLQLPRALKSSIFHGRLARPEEKEDEIGTELFLLAGSNCRRGRKRRRGGLTVACSFHEGEQRGGEEKKSLWSLTPWGAGSVPENVLRLIAGATSSPICQYIDSPVTFLHSVDARIKLAWLLALVVVPARSHIFMRIAIVIYLALLSIGTLPARVWKDQLGRVSLISGILFIMLGFGSDGAPPLVQPRVPPSHIMGLSDIPSSLGGYSYLIMKLGPFQLTRKGLSIASMSACLSFTIFQSASLCLATTTPEQLAFALRWFMRPLAFIGVPVSEITLTLLLSLRFINLVFDEVRNAALGIVARRIHWKELTVMETIDIFMSYIRRIFKNIFNHAEQISQAMIVRGFRGNSDTHKMYLLSDTSLGVADLISLSCLTGLFAAAFLCEKLYI